MQTTSNTFTVIGLTVAGEPVAAWVVQGNPPTLTLPRGRDHGWVLTMDAVDYHEAAAKAEASMREIEAHRERDEQA